MEDLPIEIIASILAFLPIKSILRFKSVCKTWSSVITSPYFSNLQLAHSSSANSNSNSNSNRLLILNRGCFLKPGYIDPNHGNHPSCFVPLFLDDPDFFGAASPPTFTLPPEPNRINAQICGSSNGLVAMVQKYVPDSMCYLMGNFLYEVMLWNPMINSYFILPNAEFPIGMVSCVSFGFGYDSFNGDYKIVKIIDLKVRHLVGGRLSCCFSRRKRQVMVYSLKQRSWGVPNEEFTQDKLTLPHKYGALVNNNVVHWMFFDEKTGVHKLRGFDLRSEEWTDLPLPDFMGNARGRCEDVKDFGVLDGCLCLVVRPDDDNANVWVMKEYGVKKSWVKLFSASEMKVLGPVSSSPIAYSKGGEEILVRKEEDSTSGLVWFNLKDKRLKSLDQTVASLDVIVCNGSLVPLPKRR